ncbi:MAG: DNA-binding response regulator, partial [Pseudonocardia sp.]|nr:DNA-binding response regulator [Pseudonocardia sp.]
MTTDAVLDRPFAATAARRTARLLIVDGEAIVRFG